MFNAGDKVIKRTEKDASNYGHVMDVPGKPGYIAVYFQRHVWIKSENLILYSEWKAKQKLQRSDLVNYWMQNR